MESQCEHQWQPYLLTGYGLQLDEALVTVCYRCGQSAWKPHGMRGGPWRYGSPSQEEYQAGLQGQREFLVGELQFSWPPHLMRWKDSCHVEGRDRCFAVLTINPDALAEKQTCVQVTLDFDHVQQQSMLTLWVRPLGRRVRITGDGLPDQEYTAVLESVKREPSPTG